MCFKINSEVIGTKSISSIFFSKIDLLPEKPTSADLFAIVNHVPTILTPEAFALSMFTTDINTFSSEK